MSQLSSLKISPHHNVVKDETGSYIPATQRPDGTWRKAIRVKEGYVPQDEVPLYESKGKQWASRNSTSPFGSPVSSNQDSSRPYIPGLVIVDEPSKKSKSKKKSSLGCEQNPGETEKKKEQSKEKVKSPSSGGNANATPSPNAKSKKDKPGNNKKAEAAPTEVSAESVVDLKKKLRNTKKKLKEIEAIEEKIRTSGSNSVDADQRKKITTKSQVLSDILQLQQLTLNS